MAVPEWLAALIVTSGRTGLAVGLFVGALVGSVVYSAVFLMLSVLTARTVALGLLYVLVWEGSLANLVGGARLLSIGQYALAVAASIAPHGVLPAHLSLLTAVVMGLMVTVLALAVATRRLAGFSIKGDAV